MDTTFSLTQLKPDPKKPVTQQEEKELRRVYDLLCDYQKKKVLKAEIADLQLWLDNAASKYQQQVSSGVIVDTERFESNNYATKHRIDELKREIAELDSNTNRKVSCGDVYEMLKTLKVKASKKDVEEMIWECDENLDGCLDWVEFKLMFTRNITDESGLEPSRMVNDPSHFYNYGCLLTDVFFLLSIYSIT